MICFISAYDLDELSCIGCPQNGTKDGLDANIVVNYIRKILTESSVKSGLTFNHLGVDSIKSYMKEDDHKGGMLHTVELVVRETECRIKETYVKETCPTVGLKSNVCNVKVKQILPEKRIEGVEVIKLQLVSQICDQGNI